MKKTLTTILILLVGVLFGADLVTKSGKIYKGYTVSGVTSSGITISCDEGVISVPLMELPLELRKKYAKKIAKKRKQEKEQAILEQYTKNLQSLTIDLEGETICVQILNNGAIATHGAYEGSFFIEDLDVSGLVDGGLIPHNADGMVHDWDAVFSQNNPDAMKKGKVLRLYSIGTFQYQSSDGVLITIPRLTVNRIKALQYIQAHPNATITGMRPIQITSMPTEEDLQRSLQQQNRIRQQNIRQQLNRQRRR